MGCFVAQATDTFNEAAPTRLSLFWLHMGRLRYTLRNQTENTAFQAVAQRFSCEDRLEDRGLMGLRVQLLPRWDFTENFLGSLVIATIEPSGSHARARLPRSKISGLARSLGLLTALHGPGRIDSPGLTIRRSVRHPHARLRSTRLSSSPRISSQTVAQARSSRVFLQMASNSRSNNQLLVFAVL
jgi:hypothetical protein